MSRRRTSDPHFAFGAVQLRCPEGHPLGLVVKQATRYTMESGLVLIDGPAEMAKIKARCAVCTAEGTHRDLQASWVKVRSAIDALAEDPKKGVESYTLGG